MNYSLRHKDNKIAFTDGLKDGIPIGLGYLAVAFSLGIAARNAGFSAFQGFLTSALCNASAGEYVGFTLAFSGATFIEMAIAIFIANARYILMSCAMSQRIDKDMPFFHRLILAFYITDEFFGISISRKGYLNPVYTYGAVLFAAPCWAIGTALGVIAGNILPTVLVSAFSVALYGMFLAIIIPPSKGDKVVAATIVICFVLSYFSGIIPIISGFSEGTRTIILTLAISSVAAILFPKAEEEQDE